MSCTAAVWENGVPDLALLSGAGARAVEPGLSDQVKAALYAPTAAVVNPWEYALAMAETAVKNGVELYLEHPVTAIRPVEGRLCADHAPGRVLRPDRNQRGGRPRGPGGEPDRAAGLPHPSGAGRVLAAGQKRGQPGAPCGVSVPQPAGQGRAGGAHGPRQPDRWPQRAAGGRPRTWAARPRALRLCGKKRAKSVPGVRFGENIRNFAGLRATADTDDFPHWGKPRRPGLFPSGGHQVAGLTAAPAIGLEAVRLLQEKRAGSRGESGF